MIGLRSSEISVVLNPLLLGGVPNLVSKWILEIPSTFTKWLTYMYPGKSIFGLQVIVLPQKYEPVREGG